MIDIHAKNVKCAIHQQLKKITEEVLAKDTLDDALRMEIKVFRDDLEQLAYGDLKRRPDLRRMLAGIMHSDNNEAKKLLSSSYDRVRNATDRYRLESGYII